MAMNLHNPIQLLRGTTKAIDAANSAVGTQFYDTGRGILRVKRSDEGFDDMSRAWGSVSNRPDIYVDANNGSDDNAGFDESSPVQTIDKALYLSTLVNSCRVPSIHLAPGTYDTDLVFFAPCIIQGSDKNTCIINIPFVETFNIYVFINNCTVNVQSINDASNAISVYGGCFKLQDCIIGASQNGTAFAYAGDNGYFYISDCDINFDNRVYNQLLSTNYSSAALIRNLTIHGSVTVDTAVCSCNGNSFFGISNFTTDGTVTGRRYYIYNNSSISVAGAGEHAIPGTIDGTVDSGTYA